MNRIAVIDLGTGNLRSVARALETAAGDGVQVRVTAEAAVVRSAERVVFPGQSAIGSVMERLRNDRALHGAVLEAIECKPFLGICIGLQALYTRSSEDGGVECLGILGGEVKHFSEARGVSRRDFTDPESDRRLKIPHMGWNTLSLTRPHPLWRGIEQNAWFYFVHSYCVLSTRGDEIFGIGIHGLEFVAAAARDTVFAVQFHPEKSQGNGLKLLSNFIDWDGRSGN